MVVVEPEGLKQLREKEDINIFAIYLYASEETRKQRMIGRGDKQKIYMSALRVTR